MPRDDVQRFEGRVYAVRERIAAAASDAGRSVDDVRLIAVSKYATVDQVAVAIEAGHRDFGENYVLDAFAKMDELGAMSVLESQLETVRWHMIGALQSNKAAKAAERFDLVHTLASVRAARAISRAMSASGRVCHALVQIHLGGGDHRAGIAPEEAAGFLEEVAPLAGVQLDGVMGVAPPGDAPRPYFAALRETRERLAALSVPNAPMVELSAGMSGDFEDAVREGATLVRVGSALFGE